MKRFCLLIGILFAATSALMARDINVRGIVTNSSGEPIQGVTIYDAENEKLLSSTNEEGKFLVIADSEGKLLFSILGMEDTEVPVEGRLTIDVVLSRSAITLDEILVKGKSKLKVVAPEETDIEIKGNYAHIKTRVKVPSHLFNTSTRLIIQPALYNVTTSKMWYLKPLVYDGWRYQDTQQRMHDFKRDADPLSPYVTLRSSSQGGDDIIAWSDSVYLDHPNHDFHCDMLMAMEDYNKVFYRDTTTIARGIVNPMRFFRYSILGTEVTDSAFFPTPEMQMRDTKGDVMLTFRVNDAHLDLNEGNNRSEMNGLINQLREFENNPDAAIKSFAIYSTSSPEGSYDHNLDLSRRRMNSALSLITENLSPQTRRYIELNSDASVATWNDLIDMLRADDLNEEADAIQEIVNRYPGNSLNQSVAVKRLPFYNSILATKYLPRLRKVSYEYVTSQFRYLSDDEIAQTYLTNPSSLSRYEFFRLYRNIAKTPQERETYIKKALEVHPKFLVAANDLAAMKIEQGEPDVSILEPFVKPGAKKIPNESRVNQIAACLAAQKYLLADSLASELPDMPEFHKPKMYVAAFNGRYTDAIQEIADESPVNEVVLLLALKSNDLAWRKAQQLGNSAEEEYLKAIAANRVDEYMAAINHLERALRLNPKLRETALVDGDIIELLEDLEDSGREEVEQ
ncbi:MAG: carboxypeptidase-like regulatory domain-containing protein [Firmicutes bacterium]|nr:carboxypeptidase-like regulatory domain-containing protein [Bacillota bacterium]MCM1401387.1 carboxypeptidase-like regulatory domain-containing protein [Bacteroides sp.]MCM1477343.1 carboxypeptidase-like regulatory domain-containing protein [Bacteroides sp.]